MAIVSMSRGVDRTYRDVDRERRGDRERELDGDRMSASMLANGRSLTVDDCCHCAIDASNDVGILIENVT